MTMNANKTSNKRTPTERRLNKQRIEEDKARAASWASQRRSKRNQAILVVATTVEVPVPVVLPPENSVLQDLLAKRTTLLQELSDLDTTIAVIH